MAVEHVTYTDVNTGKIWRRWGSGGGFASAEVGGGREKRGGMEREEQPGSRRSGSDGRGCRGRRWKKPTRPGLRASRREIILKSDKLYCDKPHSRQ